MRLYRIQVKQTYGDVKTLTVAEKTFDKVYKRVPSLCRKHISRYGVFRIISIVETDEIHG